MTEPSSRKEGFKKCRSATFSIDGFSFTIGKKFAFARIFLFIFLWVNVFLCSTVHVSFTFVMCACTLSVVTCQYWHRAPGSSTYFVMLLLLLCTETCWKICCYLIILLYVLSDYYFVVAQQPLPLALTYFFFLENLFHND